jgi:hypothetical protein
MGLLEVGTLAVVVAGMIIYATQTQDMQWAILSTDFIGRSHYPVLHPLLLGAIRVSCAVSIWVVVYRMVMDRTGLTLTVLNRDNTKRAVTLRHWERLTPFTVWSWLLQGVYFTLAGYCSLEAGLHDVWGSGSDGDRLSGPLPPLPVVAERLVWVLFEVSFPIAFLVSMVVSFVLIPGAKKSHMPVDNFFTPLALIMHNFNIWYMAFEFVANQLPFAGWHVSFVLTYALAYAIFSWFWHYYKGIYYYFFLDYERPGAIGWYVGLLLGVSLLYGAGYGCAHLQYHHSHAIPNAVSLLLERFND